MLSKNRSRFILSLQKKKVREEEGLFIIEGDKLVKEFLEAGLRLRILVAKREFIGSLSPAFMERIDETEEVSYEELKGISTLKTPHNALALVSVPARKFTPEKLIENLCIVLDFVQDPGNLGTIIRAAAWFGIRNIVCSDDCVDVYNPKVIQATMGAILHVNVYYSDIKDFARFAREADVPVYGTFLDGGSVYTHELTKKGIIILGNESKGISDELIPFVTDKIMIPGALSARPGIESLNVSMAASVIFSEFQRQIGNLSD
jgi:TrmH family RNA methyltransferase